MPEMFGATFTGRDLVALTRALLRAAPYARGMPLEMRHRIMPMTPTPDWRERLLAKETSGLTVSWGAGHQICREPEAVTADFPTVPLEPRRVLEFVESLPFELAIMPPVRHWIGEYFAPTIGANHGFLGWGMVLKGAGHDESLVSRRWLDYAPCRLLRGANDTTLVQFHDLDAAPATDTGAIDHTTLTQARRGHAWILAGFLAARHRYLHAVQGELDGERGLLRVRVDHRELTERELLDACAARRDRKRNRERAIQNIAYVFTDPAQARTWLDALWLRELECWACIDGIEVRLDEHHAVRAERPAWLADQARADIMLG